MSRPIEFLDAKPRDEAERIWHAALRREPLPAEDVALDDVLGRVLAEDLFASIDVPPFDRSIVDGFALIAADTFGAEETAPARIELLEGSVLAGVEPSVEVVPGRAIEIATGGVLPRGANAVQMVEYCEQEAVNLLVHRPVVPGAHVQGTGSDLRVGDRVFAAGTVLTSRETGVLAALGLESVRCVRRPRVAVLSTGDELVAPGGSLRPGMIYDANARMIADALRENGADPEYFGIVPDDEEKLRDALSRVVEYDAVVLSGGTSKGTGDLSFRLIDELGKPGILIHGVQVKPGKPVVLASWSGRPVVVLPGFPASATLVLRLFVLPVIRRLGGLVEVAASAVVEARVPQRMHSAPGRYEFRLVNLVHGEGGELTAYPVPKGSGSMSAFAEADGYLEIPESRDFLLAGDRARVTLLGSGARVADLVFAGSHCHGMDRLFARLRAEHGLTVKVLNLGSSGGVEAMRRGEADIAGIHLLGADGLYNVEAWSQLAGQATLLRGYVRRQGILFRADERAEMPTLSQLAGDESLRMINRPRGAGTRVLLDRLLRDLEVEGGVGVASEDVRGYDVEARSHNALAAAIAGGRADWGIGIESAALAYGLGFVALLDEDYDLLVPSRRVTAAQRLLLEVLQSRELARELSALGGFRCDARIGQVIRPHLNLT